MSFQRIFFAVGSCTGIIATSSDETIFSRPIWRNAPDAYQWKGQRLVIAAAQALCRLDGIDAGAVDGSLGPQTRYAGRSSGSTEPETWRDKTEGKPPLIPSPPKASNWPSEAGVDRFYGDKGENQVRLKLPYPMRLAWQTDQIVTSIGCHEKLHDAVSQRRRSIRSRSGRAGASAQRRHRQHCPTASPAV